MENIKDLISNEKYNVELKENVSFKEPKNYLKAISSFSNSRDIELNELILRGKNIGWDEEITDKKYDDYTFSSLNQHFMNVKNVAIDKKELISYELIKDDKLTNAAILSYISLQYVYVLPFIVYCHIGEHSITFYYI